MRGKKKAFGEWQDRILLWRLVRRTFTIESLAVLNVYTVFNTSSTKLRIFCNIG